MTAHRRYATAITSIRLLTLAVLAAAFVGSGCTSVRPFVADHQAVDFASGYASIMRAAETVRRGGDLATATVLFQQAHHLQSQEAPPLVALGEIAALAGAPGQAAAAFREALHRAPDDVTVRRHYGNALLAVDAPAQAAEQFRQVLRVEPEDTLALNALGVSLDLQGEHEEAQRIYRRALERRPDHLPLRNNLALSIALTGDVDQALAILEHLAAGTDLAPMPDGQLHHQQVQENIHMVAALSAADDSAGATAQPVAVRQAERKPPSPGILSPDQLLAAGLSPAAGPTAWAIAPEHPADGLGWSAIENLVLSGVGSPAYRWFDPTSPPVDRRAM